MNSKMENEVSKFLSPVIYHYKPKKEKENKDTQLLHLLINNSKFQKYFLPLRKRFEEDDKYKTLVNKLIKAFKQVEVERKAYERIVSRKIKANGGLRYAIEGSNNIKIPPRRKKAYEKEMTSYLIKFSQEGKDKVCQESIQKYNNIFNELKGYICSKVTLKEIDNARKKSGFSEVWRSPLISYILTGQLVAVERYDILHRNNLLLIIIYGYTSLKTDIAHAWRFVKELQPYLSKVNRKWISKRKNPPKIIFECKRDKEPFLAIEIYSNTTYEDVKKILHKLVKKQKKLIHYEFKSRRILKAFKKGKYTIEDCIPNERLIAVRRTKYRTENPFKPTSY